ncbi:MucBP domain-containing protein [Lactococcus sp.]|uniref:MucBP domain-containing protein n=1 Tax=Lactococcus sp. TaxID=44273 RepID=UPI0035B40158
MKNRTFLLKTLLFTVFLAVIFLVLQPVSADSGGISATTDGIVLENQPHKTIAGNGHVYPVSKGLTGEGKKGSPVWLFTADGSQLYDEVIVYVCGQANQYITYRLVVTGAGQYELDASPYLCGNQGLAIGQITPHLLTGTVKVHYLEQGSKTPIAPSKTLNSPTWQVGQTAPTYETSAPEIIDTADGTSYRLIKSLLPDNQTGNYQVGQTIEVTYYYEKILSEVQYTGTIIIHFIDEQGKRIAPSMSALTESWLASEQAPDYQTWQSEMVPEKISFNGQIYKLATDKIPSNANGIYQPNKQIDIYYVYQLLNSPVSPELPDGPDDTEHTEPSDTPNTHPAVRTDKTEQTQALAVEKQTAAVKKTAISKVQNSLPETGQSSHTGNLSMVGLLLFLGIYPLLKFRK